MDIAKIPIGRAPAALHYAALRGDDETIELTG
jgi:hypothetical protein